MPFGIVMFIDVSENSRGVLSGRNVRANVVMIDESRLRIEA